MGKKFTAITPEQQAFIARQAVWFVATCAPGARINLSPKGMDSLRILNPNRLLWLNLVGSGNETAAHLQEDPRMTLMFCAFDHPPQILRLYGQARAIHPGEPEWESALRPFPSSFGARQVVQMEVDLVHTSCGFGVPLYTFQGERQTLDAWLQAKGEEGLARYQQEHNRVSLDGRPIVAGGS